MTTSHYPAAPCGCTSCIAEQAQAVIDRVKAQGGRVPLFTEVMLRAEIAAALRTAYECNEAELAVLRVARHLAALHAQAGHDEEAYILAGLALLKAATHIDPETGG